MKKSELRKIIKEEISKVLAEASEFKGKMLRDIEVGGKGIGPFADTPKVKLQKGTEVRLVIQQGSMGTSYQFWPIEGGGKYGSLWDSRVEDFGGITRIVDYN